MRCSAADFWQGNYLKLLQIVCLSFTIASVLCYAIIWIKLNLIRDELVVDDRNGVLKSLAIILLIIIFGWIFNMAMRSLIAMLIPDPVPVGYILMNYTDIVLTFIGIANTFVLYKCRS